MHTLSRRTRITVFPMLVAVPLAAGACSSSSTSPPAGATAGSDASQGESPEAGPVEASTTQGNPTPDASSGSLPDASPDASGDGGPVSVTLSFAAKVGGVPFSCAAGTTYSNLGTVPTKAIVQDFRFYVHDVSLMTSTGTAVPVTLDQDGVWQYQNLALLDFENGVDNCASEGNAPTNLVVKGTIPRGEYTGISFKLGVPFALDHINPATAPSPLNVTPLQWDWQYGYKYWKNNVQSVDVIPDPDGGADASLAAPGFYVHLGATGCNGDPASDAGPVTSCSNPNITTVTLSGFNPATSTVVADFAALVAYSNLDYNLTSGMDGCMSLPFDPGCVPVFQQFGLVLSSGMPADPPTQAVFHVE